MDIPRHLLQRYIQSLTVSYFDPEDLPPATVEGYGGCVENLRLEAIELGDLEALKVALEYLLAHPGIDASTFAGDRYPYDDSEVREIIRFARATIWPDAGPIPEGGPSVRLVDLSLPEWRARRGDGDPGESST